MMRTYSPSTYDEIAAAVFAVLSKTDDWKDVWWISVGLVNDALELKWQSFVNHESDHARPYCGDNNASAKCTSKRGCSAPPCVLERISKLCAFRKALRKLEDATMRPKSHSQGRISIILWNEFKEAPYISLHKTDHPWLIAKACIKRNLQQRSNPLLRKTDPSKYEKIAKPCMVSACGRCSAALIPLLQHRAQGDNAYVGAITICASAECKIWRQLPHVRAVATSLLETSRHLRAVLSRKDKDPADLLLDALTVDLDVGKNLFAGKCLDPHCPMHRKYSKDDDKRKRHDHECRLLRKRTFFVGHNGKPIFKDKEESLDLQKSLFSFGKIRVNGGRGALCEKIKQLDLSDRDADSHATTLLAVAEMFSDAFGVNIAVPVKEKEVKFVWPIKPGILVLVGLYDICRQLRGGRRGVGCAIRASIIDNSDKSCRTVQFAFALKGQRGAKSLEKRLQSSSPIGETTTTILDVCDGKPTRRLVPASQWEDDIVAQLNAPAPTTDGNQANLTGENRVIRWRIITTSGQSWLIIEWNCPLFEVMNLSETLSS